MNRKELFANQLKGMLTEKDFITFSEQIKKADVGESFTHEVVTDGGITVRYTFSAESACCWTLTAEVVNPQDNKDVAVERSNYMHHYNAKTVMDYEAAHRLFIKVDRAIFEFEEESKMESPTEYLTEKMIHAALHACMSVEDNVRVVFEKDTPSDSVSFNFYIEDKVLYADVWIACERILDTDHNDWMVAREDGSVNQESVLLLNKKISVKTK